MGTKNDPAPFDCYANAEPDEPMFVLLARDRVAPDTVRMWAALRALHLADDREAIAYLGGVALGLVERSDTSGIPADEHAQIAEALDCADAMQQWRETNR